MVQARIIPALTLAADALVKTKKFRNPSYVGDPLNAVRIFNEKEVDELLVLDITATREKREPNYSLIEKIAGECFMPLAYGGAITTAKQAKIIFELGVEKICLQNAIFEDFSLIKEITELYGSQSVIASIDIKRSYFGTPYAFNYRKRKSVKRNWLEIIKGYVSAGAGEILLNSVDKDGMRSGPDLKLILEASNIIEVPLIALGGVSSLDDMRFMINSGASAVAAGAFFVYHGDQDAVLITYPDGAELESLFN